MSRHTLLLEPGSLDQPTVVPPREEGRHAVRVKRAEVGEQVTILDGAGQVGTGEITAIRPDLVIRVVETRRVERVTPRVEVWSATPKGPRLDDMIEQLSQAGAALWRPLETALGVVEPGEGKRDRCRRVARESAKQCGRAWLMEIADAVSFERALTSNPDTTVAVADAGGDPWSGCATPVVRVLVGPEGGFTESERSRMHQAGVVAVRLGPHIMRIETAALCATARILGA